MFYVENIEVHYEIRIAGKNTFVKAVANVTVHDGAGAPLGDATVYGAWSGATSDSDSGVTGADGKVTVQSDEVKKLSKGSTFTFTVNNILKEGWSYAPDTNNETSDSVTY